ncbi:hypothetical protein LY90DRAFT_513289 [Neocallimastix californiae]|uniref:Uncharacterized protein n=1 Tax=Neocallimastix californiae TaxID=1754190 RepID=A0A1Y2AZH8_9FUNG|nr:hypothetical protein LY90DRAFT_513289 [Neocallimastix californiae]|eukprot:ORY27978.1 hypothetical protein LY90DRAFT_513289 [Neocallimastix californiae]
MKNKIYLTIFIIILCIPFINGESLFYEDIPKYLTKDEVLKLKNAAFVAFYCKGDLCCKTEYGYTEYFAEFPDENGRMKKYITKTCAHDKIGTEKCNGKSYAEGQVFYTNCTADSDCLSNKCLKNVCVFNDENPIVHCDDIYLGGSRSYMYCGKQYGNTCKTDDECSSKICFEDNTCNMQHKGPSDSEGAMGMIYSFYVLIITLILLVCCCCYSICKKEIKK